MPAARWGIILLVLLSLWGCGYRPLGSAGTTADQPAPTLAIPLFANRSVEVGLEAIMANAMINAFAQTGAVRVVPGDKDADYVLEGKVRSVEYSSVAFYDVTRSLVRRVTLRVDLTLKRQTGGKVVWKDSQMLQENYVVDPNYQIGEATKDEGIRRAAQTLAKRVMEKVLLVI
jgi:hypothetical protein